MKRSKNPTQHILIKANTSSAWESIEFAIIYLTESWKVLIASRLQAIEQFKTDNDFNCHIFWDASIRFYNSPGTRELVNEILFPHDDWAYVTLSPETERTFQHPNNPLQAHQLLITANGIAQYKAYEKRTNKEYWTEEFNLKKLLRAH
ncbi:hypothetical protein [Pedobacter nyackensis]|uniref:Uncharacterized protein n=1 Tax=Pedobacter nyackensis TaxID=475255 RepID=A0A1W2F4V6_9SPHI|nr:hypothetical protein [Pedobacter nyackensis]SMD16924.1 hypothetical protein SAMN04488101_12121 [Pedobacter nyackensis]